MNDFIDTKQKKNKYLCLADLIRKNLAVQKQPKFSNNSTNNNNNSIRSINSPLEKIKEGSFFFCFFLLFPCHYLL